MSNFTIDTLDFGLELLGRMTTKCVDAAAEADCRMIRKLYLQLQCEREALGKEFPRVLGELNSSARNPGLLAGGY